jgi:hypothetical protein
MPESFAPFPVRKPKAFAFSRVIDDLARPLVSERVKHGYPKGQPMEVWLQEIPFHAAAMYLATDIVQQANDEVGRKMLKERFQKDKNVMLLFSSRPHIHDPENPVGAT